MSTLRADSVAPSAGGTSRSLPRGVAAAWVYFNGTGTIAINDSNNVTSITDGGTGIYSTAWANDMSSASYGVSAAYQRSTATTTDLGQGGLYSRAAGSIGVNSANVDGVATDFFGLDVTAKGTLA